MTSWPAPGSLPPAGALYPGVVAGDIWSVGDAYEAYVGRWSRAVAVSFLGWLGVPASRRWLDVGCGTGALTDTILAVADPREVVGVDSSAAFVAHVGARIADPRTRFQVGDATSLPLPDGRFDVAVSGLVLNFVPKPERGVAELVRVTAEGGLVAAYVWDYAAGMALMRYFWDAAVDLDPAAGELDEGRRFPLCDRQPLADLWAAAGMLDVAVTSIEVPTVFASFDDYWAPFLGGQGPAPGYVTSLDPGRHAALRDLLQQRLPTEPDGSIRLSAAAWAVRGRR
jgi:SAM-dependent methyltransferase